LGLRGDRGSYRAHRRIPTGIFGAVSRVRESPCTGELNNSRTPRGRGQRPIMALMFDSRPWNYARGRMIEIIVRSSHSAEFCDRPTVVDDRAGPADRVEISGIERDAHVAVNRGREVGWGDGAFLDVAAVGFGGADDLAVPEPSAGQGHGHDH